LGADAVDTVFAYAFIERSAIDEEFVNMLRGDIDLDDGEVPRHRSWMLRSPSTS
jgi:hypothetical protein